MRKLLGLFLVALLVGSLGICTVSGAEIEMPQLPGDETMPPLPRPESPVGTITIRAGWNLVAMPVLPYEPYTIRQFIEAVAGQVIDDYWQVPVVAVYKNGCFKRYPKQEYSYNMVPGEAYFVYAIGPMDNDLSIRSETIVEIEGRSINPLVSLNLNRGWNGVSPVENDIVCVTPGTELPAGVDLSMFSKRLVEQEVKAIKIAFWSTKQQYWEIFDLPLKNVIARPIKPDEGFFLLCEENGLYVPGLNSNTEPPVPPGPPVPIPPYPIEG